MFSGSDKKANRAIVYMQTSTRCAGFARLLTLPGDTLIRMEKSDE